MTIDEFQRQFRSFEARLASLGVQVHGEPGPPDVDPDSALEALGVAMEELRVAEEEIRRQNHALQESRATADEERARYRDLFDHAPDGYLVTDLRGVIREGNVAAATLINIRREFLIGKPLVVFVAEADWPAYRTFLDRLARHPGSAQCELHMSRRHAGPFVASVSVLAVPDPMGGVGLRWTIRDISDRKRAEEELRTLNNELERRVQERSAELEAEFRAGEQLLIQAHAVSMSGPGGQALLEFVNAVDAILWTGDARTGRFTFVSGRAESSLGFPASRWVKEPDFWASRLHAEDRAWAIRHRARCLERGVDFEMEYRLLAAEGRPIWFRESVRVVGDSSGKPVELRGILVNISKRKKVERQFYAERRELSARLEDMTYLHELSGQLASMRELHAILDETLAGVMAVLGAPKGIIRLFDRERGELVLAASRGLSGELTTYDERIPLGTGACGRAAQARGHVFVADIATDGGDDHDRHAAGHGGFRAIFSAPIVDRHGAVAGTIATYFDEPHRPYDRQVRLVELFVRLAADMIQNASLHHEIREANRRREQFLAILAHELRNPLAAIRNSAFVLRHDPRDVESLALINRQVQQLNRLVDDMLDASRISQGKVELRRETMDLSALAAAVAEEVGPAARARRHELRVSLADRPLWVDADPGRMEQVLVNLLNNAIKYSDPGAVIELSAARIEGEAVVRVRDTGRGIAPEALPGLFELFSQAEATGRPGSAGLGIGLWIVRSLVELHGGRVIAASAGVGQGSEFTVYLPIAEAPEHRNGNPTS